MAVHIVYKVYANIDRSIRRPVIATAASSGTLVKRNFGGKGGRGGRLRQHDELFFIVLTNMGSAIAIHHRSLPDLPRDILNYVSSG